MKKKLTPAFVKSATVDPPGAERTIFWDKTMPGFGLVVTAAEHRSYVVQSPGGRRSKRMKIDSVLDLSEARKRAKVLLGEVAHGGDPLGEKRKVSGGSSFKTVTENYLRREGNHLRSAKQRRSIFDRLIFPVIGAKPIDEVRRSDIAKLLDKVKDKS